jgi:hypothetical protein
MRLEADDPHTSVTFVCLAATGARVDDLFAPDRSGQNRALGPGPVLPAQLDELRAVAGRRPADVLVLAVGFNDARAIDLLGVLLRGEIRFVDPLRLLVNRPTRGDWAAAPDLEAPIDPAERGQLEDLDPDARRAAITGDVGLIYDLAEAAQAGLDAARGQLDRLATAIDRDPLLAGAEVYLLEYPDPTRDGCGASGAAILDDLVPGLRINRRELALARERLLRPLNGALREAAGRRGWTFVGGIFEAFAAHGYPAADTWFVRAEESERLQGPRLSFVGYLRGEVAPGALHPNRRGHEAIAERLYLSFAASRVRPPCTGD